MAPTARVQTLNTRAPKYQQLLHEAVQAADTADIQTAIDALRSALSVRFDGRIASALDLLHVHSVREPQRAVDLRRTLKDLLEALPEPEPEPVQESSATHPAGGHPRDEAASDAHPKADTPAQNIQATVPTPAIPGPDRSEELVDMARDAYLAGDLETALDRIEEANRSPLADEAQRLRDAIRSSCTQLFAAQLQPLDRVVTPAVGRGEWRNLRLNAQRTFLLSQADGMASIADLIDVSGLGELEALRTIKSMMDEGILDVS